MLNNSHSDPDVFYNPHIVCGDYAEVVDCGINAEGGETVVWFENTQGDIRRRSFGIPTDALLFFETISP